MEQQFSRSNQNMTENELNMETVAEWSWRTYPAPLGAGGVGSIPANPDAQNVPSFRSRRFEMKLSPFLAANVSQPYHHKQAGPWDMHAFTHTTNNLMLPHESQSTMTICPPTTHDPRQQLPTLHNATHFG